MLAKTKVDSELPKNIIISHVYSSDNKGDAALTSVLIRDIKRTFPGASLTILTLDAVTGKSKFEGVPEKPSFMYCALSKYRNPVVKLGYTLYMTGATLAWAVGQRIGGLQLYLPAHLRAVAQLYAKADLVVPVGGGYIRSRNGLMNRLNIPLLLHPLLFGYLLGKPTVLYSQSVGPFQNGFEKWLVRLVLSRMTLILLRENTSLTLLASLGVTRNTTRAIDSGFLLQSRQQVDIRSQYHIPPGRLLVGVTVRAWLTGAAQTAYEKAVAAALDNLVKTAAAHIVFIPQVTAKGDDDRVVNRRVHAFMHHRDRAIVIEDAPDHHRIKAIYDNLDILLGTRFHSVIFSLTSYVPVLAIEYEHKTSGIMHDLKLDAWVIKIEDVTGPKLIELLQKLVQEQTAYLEHLHIHLPPYLRQAKQAANLLAAAYYGAISQAAAEPKPLPRNQSSI